MHCHSQKRIAVTGLGPISSLGIGTEAFWEGIKTKQPKIVKESVSIDDQHWDSFYVHKVIDFNLSSFGIEENLLDQARQWKGREIPIDLQYLLAVSKLALDDSKICLNKEENKLGLILAHENPGLNDFAEKAFLQSFDLLNGKKNLSKIKFLKKAYSKLKKDVYELQTFMLIFHVGRILDLHGISFFINNACASGLYAIEMASLLIKSGHCSAVLVAAADHPDIYKYLWFKEMNLYSNNGKAEIFSKNSNGFIFGDGGAGIVLEDLEHAQKRNANIYSEYLGGSFSSENWKVIWPAIKQEYYKNTIVETLNKANISSNDIDLIVPHGVGLNITDRHESNVLVEIFSNKPYYTAFKPFVGHNLGGSTLIETVILNLSIKHGIIPPTLSHSDNHDKIQLKFVKDFINYNPKYAMKTVTAFAGFNGAAVFKKYKE